MQRRKHLVSVLLAAATASSLSGCLLVPVMDSVSKIGVTKTDRMRVLPTQVKGYQDALYWGNHSIALGYVEPQSVEQFRTRLRSRPRDEKIVEARVLSTDFDPEAYEANVVVAVRHFNPSTLIVEEDEETQRWVFGLQNGWKISSVR